MHWPVSVDALRPLVPAALSLDLWEGQALVGVVPFAMDGVRPNYIPRFAAMDFLETNVRTYVHVNGKPGVYFLSLEAASALAVAAARVTFGLPYFYARMRLAPAGEGRVHYQTRRVGNARAALDVTYSVGEPLGASEPGSLEHFLLERYLLFVERHGRLQAGTVHHVPYPAHRATVHHLREGLVACSGLPPAEGAPRYVHYSPGVDVEVFALRDV